MLANCEFVDELGAVLVSRWEDEEGREEEVVGEAPNSLERQPHPRMSSRCQILPSPPLAFDQRDPEADDVVEL